MQNLTSTPRSPKLIPPTPHIHLTFTPLLPLIYNVHLTFTSFSPHIQPTIIRHLYYLHRILTSHSPYFAILNPKFTFLDLAIALGGIPGLQRHHGEQMEKYLITNFILLLKIQFIVMIIYPKSFGEMRSLVVQFQLSMVRI